MFQKLQSSINYQFAKLDLLVLALTHSSAANERQDNTFHNERLEFLGDAVLELCVSRELYTRFPNAREGQLTAMRSRLVNQDSLARLAKKIRLDELLVLGKGEEVQGGRYRDSLLSDALEAVLGAVFEDGGFTEAERVVLLVFAGEWPLPEERLKTKDPKSHLQEISQQRFKDRPVYHLNASTGPEHAKEFSVQVVLPENSVFVGTGTSLKRAEQDAARKAMNFLASLPSD